jgi:hypothetical protein
VLDLASSEAGQLHILHEPLDLTEVLQVWRQRLGENWRMKKVWLGARNFPNAVRGDGRLHTLATGHAEPDQ